mmetsp:Transcript_15940/g.28713  ORF Transcript_15940/g.28713 Transcript_15940/m.28713 type:complete len:181 (+) Transcript_15940:66-608(+)
MISYLSRQLLPRTTATAAVVTLQRTRPSVAIAAAVTQQQYLYSHHQQPHQSPNFSSHYRSFSSFDDDDEVKVKGIKDKEKKLNRDAIADILCAEYGLKMAESKRVLNTVFDTIVESVTKGETVSIPSFGKFVPVDFPARAHVDPSKPVGSPKVWKEATTRVKFRPFKHFKECVAEGKVAK